MIELNTLVVFSFATILVVIAPGPGMLFVISSGISGGRKDGIISALGTSTGITIHILASTSGLSLIIYLSEIGFSITKIVGAIYLIFLAIKLFISQETISLTIKNKNASNTSLYWKGLLVNALNPKVTLFFMAFIPQFINPSNESVETQTFIFGVIFQFLTIIIFIGYGIFASIIGKFLLRKSKAQKIINWSIGVIFTFLGIRLAFSSR